MTDRTEASFGVTLVAVAAVLVVALFGYVGFVHLVHVIAEPVLSSPLEALTVPELMQAAGAGLLLVAGASVLALLVDVGRRTIVDSWRARGRVVVHSELPSEPPSTSSPPPPPTPGREEGDR